jgi:hypothetical protein
MVGNAPEEEPQLDVSVAEGLPSTSTIGPSPVVAFPPGGKTNNGLLLKGVQEVIEKRNRKGV